MTPATPHLLHLTATEYLTPLREGGSLPAVVATDRGDPFVVKFRGAGQGPKALVAELLAAGLAGALGLPLPQPALVDLAEGFGLGEPDPEIQDLLRGSAGVNFGLAYLPGALGYEDRVDGTALDPQRAAEIVWFDAFISNVDRTPRNPNLLMWEQGVWLIDHGASLYFHHATPPEAWQARATAAFAPIKDHILLKRAAPLNAAADRLRERLDPATLRGVVAALPDGWLDGPPESLRAGYLAYFEARLAAAPAWTEEAEDARRRA